LNAVKFYLQRANRLNRLNRLNPYPLKLKPVFSQMVKRLKKRFILPAFCPYLTNRYATVGFKMKTGSL
jgi:hypothetical protein